MKKIVSFILIAAFLTGCSPKSAQNEAENTLLTFFSELSNGQYSEAVKLYGGDYENLAGMNPDLSPTDYEALWKRGCEQNGFVCMEVLEIIRVTEGDSQIEFNVTFKTKDGKRFEFTGCCGETLPEPITEWSIQVEKGADGNYKVLSLPPYVP
ncbi:MAG: hypothetical protein Fur0017_15540 [Anaerolineales bacterium]